MNKILTAALMSLVFVGICVGAEEQATEAVAQVTVATEAVTESVATSPSTVLSDQSSVRQRSQPKRKVGLLQTVASISPFGPRIMWRASPSRSNCSSQE